MDRTIEGIAMTANLVDRNGDMITMEALKKAEGAFQKLVGRPVYLRFDHTNPVGWVESITLKSDGVHVRAHLRKPPEKGDWVLRPSFRVNSMHTTDGVRVIEDGEFMGFSLVPREDAH